MSFFVEKFQQAENPFFWPYVVSCAGLTFLVLLRTYKLRPLAALREMFARRIFATKSARTDVVVTVVYMLFFNAPTNALYLALMGGTYELVLSGVFNDTPFPYGWRLPPLIEGGVAAVWALLMFDLATYVSHRAMHKIPALWDIHCVHHSPESLNLFSAYRQHPADRLIRNSTAAVFSGGGLALLHYFLPQQTFAPTIAGVSVASFFFLFTGHLQHSHVPVHFPKWMSVLVLSPHLHQLHHSSAERHRDKNFGGVFPYWDKLWGTYCDEPLKIGDLQYGIAGGEDPIRNDILRCYWHPLYSIGRRAVSALTPGKRREGEVAELRDAEQVAKAEVDAKHEGETAA